MISRTGGFLSHALATASLVLATPAIGVLTPTVSAQPPAGAARDTSKKKDLPLPPNEIASLLLRLSAKKFKDVNFTVKG